MPILPLLKNPEKYQPDSWFLDAEHHIQWYCASAVHVVETQITEHQQRHGANSQAKIDLLRSELRQFMAEIQSLAEHVPTSTFKSDMKVLKLLRKHGLNDPYEHLKREENETACRFYQQRVNELDRLAGNELTLELIQGVMAGNRFDMGCIAGIEDYQNHGADFHSTIDSLKKRPWLIDEFDLFAPFFEGLAARPRKTMFFVDNAGADFVLGCLPLIRALAKQDCEVVVACNGMAAMNDITVDEARTVTEQLAEHDLVLRRLLEDGRICFIDSGGESLLIDFSTVSVECAKAAIDTELLIIEGMGRSVESNFYTEFKCPTLRLCLLKDEFLAGRIDGEIFDIVCRFEDV